MQCRPVLYYYLHREDKWSTAFKWALCDGANIIRAQLQLHSLLEKSQLWSLPKFWIHYHRQLCISHRHKWSINYWHTFREATNFPLKSHKSVSQIILFCPVCIFFSASLCWPCIGLLLFIGTISHKYWFHPTGSISHESCFITPTSPLSSRVRAACLSRLGLFIGCILVSPNAWGLNLISLL